MSVFFYFVKNRYTIVYPPHAIFLLLLACVGVGVRLFLHKKWMDFSLLCSIGRMKKMSQKTLEIGFLWQI